MAGTEERSETPGPKWEILRWFSDNPIYGLVCLVIAVVSLIATFYFGLASLKTRDLSVYVHPIRTIIVRSGRTSDLHILYKGQPVSTDVTASGVLE